MTMLCEINTPFNHEPLVWPVFFGLVVENQMVEVKLRGQVIFNDVDRGNLFPGI